jgi:hypothetical protein
MIQAIIKMELNPLSENPDERILEATRTAKRIINVINKEYDFPKMELFTVKCKHDGVTMDDIRSIDEAKELRGLSKGNREYDECDEEFV